MDLRLWSVSSSHQVGPRSPRATLAIGFDRTRFAWYESPPQGVSWRFFVPESGQPFSSSISRATEVFRNHGGVMRMADASRAGVSSANALLDARLGATGANGPRALPTCRVADLPPLSEPDLVTVAKKVSQG